MNKITDEEAKKIGEALHEIEKRQDNLPLFDIDRGHDIAPSSVYGGEIPSAGQDGYF